MRSVRSLNTIAFDFSHQSSGLANCTPKFTSNNCFVAELTLKLFGNPTDGDVEEILRVVRDLLETDSVGEALGVENGLIADATLNSTETDAGQGSVRSQGSTNSQQMSTLRKSLISMLVLIIVALAGFAATADRDELYGA